MADCTQIISSLYADVDPNDIAALVDMVREETVPRQKRSLADKQARLKELQAEGKAFAAKKLKEHIDDQLKMQKAVARIEGKRFGKRTKSGLLSLFQGREAADISVASLTDHYTDRFLSILNSGLRERGLLDAAKSGRYDKAIYEAMFSGKKAVGADADIVNGIAKVYKALNEDIRRAMNDAGASIFKRADYVHRQFHNGEKIRAATDKTWIDFLYRNLDMEKSFDHLRLDNGALDHKAIAEALVEDFDRFSRNHDSVLGTTIEDDLGQIFTNLNKVDRLNKARSYHFKSGEALFEYNQRFGMDGSLLDRLNREYRKGAKTAAMLEMFGTKPRQNMKTIIDTATKRANMDNALRRSIEDSMDKAFDTASGRGDYGVNNSLALVGRSLRQMATLSKLGWASMSGLMDISSTILHTKTATGDNILTSSVRSMGAWLRSVPASKRRAVAAEMLQSTDAFLRELRIDMIGSDYRPGFLARRVDNLFSITGLNAVTDIARKANAQLAMEDLHKAVNTKKLTTAQKNLFSRYEFTAEDIEVLREFGREITPRTLFDADVSRFRSEKQKNDLFKKVHIMIGQRVRRGSPTPDARVRQTLGLYNEAGTPAGEAWRMIAQFKSSVTKMTFDTGFAMRAVSESGDLRNRHSYIAMAQFMVLATGVGFMRDQLKQRLDTDNWDKDLEVDKNMVFRAMQTGGALGLIGDLVFPVLKDSSATAKMAAVGGFAAGPVIETGVKGVYEMSKILSGEPDEQTLNYLIRQIPYNNMWFLMNLNKTFVEMLAQPY